MPRGLLLLLLFASVAAGAEPASKPATPPVLPPAFDLSSLPSNGPNGFVAFRPAALADWIPATADEVKSLMAYGLGLMGGQPNAADLPKASELEQAILKVELRSTYDRFAQPGERPHTFGVVCSGGMIRALKPLNWMARLEKWFPKGEEVKHAGSSYYRIPMTLQEVEFTMAAFAPDDRTICMDSEEQMRAFLDARKSKKAVVKPLAGWDTVSQDLIALSLDFQNKTAFTGMRESHDSKQFRPITRFEDTVSAAVLGLKSGETTTLRAIIAPRRGKPAAEKAVQQLLQVANGTMKDAMKANEEDYAGLTKWASTALNGAKVNGQGKTIAVTLTAPGDVRKMIAALLAPAE